MSDKFILQNQRIPESLKTKEWDMQHVYSYVNHISRVNDSFRKQQQIKCWKYYLGISDQEKENNNSIVVKPYGLSLGLEYMHYPLISEKIEQVVGEYLTRPVMRKTYVINKRAKSKKMDSMFAMVAEDILRETNKELEEAVGFVPDTENPEMELPEDVSQYIEEGNFKTESEEVSDIILEQVLVAKGQERKIKDLLVDLLVQDECIAEIGEEDGHPTIERLDIFETEIDWDPEKEIQTKSQYEIRSKFYGFNEILNSYELTPKEEALLSSYSSQTSSMTNALEGFDTGVSAGSDAWFQGEGNTMRIRCTEMTWISQKRIRVKVTVNKHTEKEIYTMLPDDYIPKKTDQVKTVWSQYKRRILMVGPELVLRHGPFNERYGRIDNVLIDNLPLVGLRRNNFLGAQIQSMASKLIQLQDFASETLFELRLAMRRNSGKVLVYDAAQIPKQFLKGGNYQNALNRVMHHAKKDQFLIINSQDKQSRFQFNQFTSLDLGTRGQLEDLFKILALIDKLAASFVGVSEERGGQVDKYQTATGTERAVAQSTARSEVYISPFDSFIQEVLMMVLMKGKYTYEENEIVEFIFGGHKSKFFKVYPSFFQDDIGVSIGSNFKERKKKEVIDSSAQMAFSNANTPELLLQLIEVLNSENSSESERILKRGLKALDEVRQQNNKAIEEAAKTEAASKEKIEAEANQVKRDGFAKDIKVAEIQNAGKAIVTDKNIVANATSKLAEIEQRAIEAESKKN